MLIKQVSPLKWIEFSLFQKYPQIVHASFMRHGGLSQAPYKALNASFLVGDKDTAVAANIALIEKTLKIPPITFAKQTHSTRIHLLDKPSPPNMLEGDALFTKTQKVPLGILHADCQAAIFFDPRQNVLCLTHAGWRGQALGLYTKTIKTLVEQAGCLPENILVGISPSLGPQHAEFYLENDPLSEIQKRFEITPNHFDLWQAAFYELTKAGLKESNIELAKICTHENNNFFSYRKEGITGRLATVAMLL